MSSTPVRLDDAGFGIECSGSGTGHRSSKRHAEDTAVAATGIQHMLSRIGRNYRTRA
jgi:hypothetical protein